ncbi:hypothetical protein OAF20_01635 [bacterium]|nr:hypothetical protein [bacterium]
MISESRMDSLGKVRPAIQYPPSMLLQDAIEWPDEVEVLVDQLENESTERDLTREERALMDIYETVPVLESQDCLHEFWQSGMNHQRIINSFELIGATGLVDPLNASRWCETRTEDRNDYSETESSYLTSIEEELAEGMDELVDLVVEFIEEEME